MIRITLVAAALLISGCGTPPRERFFTLDAPEPPVAAPDAASAVIGPKGVRRTGRSVVHQKVATKFYDAVAAAYSAALATISREIAAAIKRQYFRTKYVIIF